MTLSADSKAMPSAVGSPTAEEQKTYMLGDGPPRGSSEDLGNMAGGIEIVAALAASKPAETSPEKTPSRRGKAESRMSKSSNPVNVSTSSARRKLACLIVPKEFNADSEEVTVYELGSKAVEIEAPTFQINIARKL